MKRNLLTAILLLGLITACSAAPATTPASDSAAPASPTAAPVPTEAVNPTAAPIQPTNDATSVSFANDVLPIFQSRCFNCHGGRETEEGLNLTTYAGLMAGSENGPVIAPGDSENSLLAEQVVSQEMPKRGPKLTPPQVQIILDWISQGALNN